VLSVFGASADMTVILQLLDQHTHHFAYTCKIAVDTLHEARTLNLISVVLQVDSQHRWAAHDDKLDTRLGMGKKRCYNLQGFCAAFKRTHQHSPHHGAPQHPKSERYACLAFLGSGKESSFDNVFTCSL
jgi:hypothetical protein